VPAVVQNMAAVAAPSQKFRLWSYRGCPTLEIGITGWGTKRYGSIHVAEIYEYHLVI
jgi:hypothetical protein